jgi:DNA-binding transcriptional ArsR family regulator
MTPESENAQNDEAVAKEQRSMIQVVCDPQRIKILIDPMRRKILKTMREGLENEDGTTRKEMTVPEIARKLGVSAPKCYHHLDLLLDHNFVRVARKERKKRTSITYYERTSPFFVLASTIDEVERKEGIKKEHPAIKIIQDGFKLDLSDEEAEEAQELIDKYRSIYHDVFVKVSKRLQGNIPDERLSECINIVTGVLAFKIDEYRDAKDKLSKYLELGI